MPAAATAAASPTAGWVLRICVSGFEALEKSLVVTGDMHIGRVIFQLVEQLDSFRQDWSDFALWWPAKKQWLNRTKMTLDQYGVQADAVLTFTRIHKQIRLVMPDQQVVELSVDFSVNLYQTCKKVCKYIGIRHAEELSMLTCPSYNSSSTNDEISKSKNSNNNGTLSRKTGANSSYSTMPSSKSGQQLAIKDGPAPDSVSSSTTSTLNNSSSNNSNSLLGSKFKRDRSNSISRVLGLGRHGQSAQTHTPSQSHHTHAGVLEQVRVQIPQHLRQDASQLEVS